MKKVFKVMAISFAVIAFAAACNNNAPVEEEVIDTNAIVEEMVEETIDTTAVEAPVEAEAEVVVAE